MDRAERRPESGWAVTSVRRSPPRTAEGSALRRPRSGEGRVVWAGVYERLARDPSFGPLVKRIGPVRLRRSAPDPFAFLVRAVTYQQLAGGAAATIHGRLVAALGGGVTPASVRRASDDALRAAGLSRAKLASIRDLAEQVAAGAVALDDLRDLSDEGVVERLVRVRGIGRWTAEMLLIFHLRRPGRVAGARSGGARRDRAAARLGNTARCARARADRDRLPAVAERDRVVLLARGRDAAAGVAGQHRRRGP